MTDCERFQIASGLTLQQAYENGNTIQLPQVGPFPTLEVPPGQPGLVLGSSDTAGALPVTMYFSSTSYVVFANNSVTFESGPIAGPAPAVGPIAINVPVAPSSQDAARALSGPAAAIVFPPTYQWAVTLQLSLAETIASAPVLLEYTATGSEAGLAFSNTETSGSAFAVAPGVGYAPGQLTLVAAPASANPIIWTATYSLIVTYP